MENSSFTERLIDFGIDANDCDEVLEPNDQQQQKEQQNQQHQPNNQLKQQQKHNKNNQQQTKNQSQHRLQNQQQQQQTVSPPPPTTTTTTKNKSTKNSTKNSSKKISKIPRSPSCASNSSYNNSFLQHLQHHTATSSSIPPKTPPLPVNYQNKNKHMNGCSKTPTSSTTTAKAATPCLSVLSAPSSPTTPSSPTALASPTSAIPISATSNNSFFKSNKNSNKNHNNNSNNVQISSPPSTAGGLMVGGAMGANGNHSQHRGSVGSGGGGVGGAGVGVGAGNVINIAASRRPQIQISPIAESSPKHYQYLTLTVRKDENGYGMKVSGDNPVYVESVKPGGAAQIAGLVAGDMILKVNGQEVRSEKHPTVVSLIKASTIVELAVKRTPKMARPNSVGIVPSTPILSGRDRTASITGPQPVDSIKRREMESYKIQTLQKMLEQEKLNLERLKGDINNPSYKLSEANIRKLREQLRQVGAEDAPATKYSPATNINNNNNKNTTFLSPTQLQNQLSASHQHHLQQLPQQHSVHPLATTPQPHPPQSSPAFLSLLPRSLSSLSLGGRKNKIDKDLITSPLNNTTDFLHTSNLSSTTPLAQQHLNMSQSLHQHRISSPQQQHLFYQHQQQLIQLQQHQHQLQQQQQQQQQNQHRHKETPKSSNSSKHKNKFASQPKNLIKEDIPPPLPQRNPPRNLLLETATATTVCSPAAISSNNSSSSSNTSSSSNNNNTNNSNSNSNEWRRPMVPLVPVSDLDHSNLTTGSSSPQLRNSPQLIQATTPPAAAGIANVAAASSAQKKRSKIKTKALSDPKMSTQMFLQMETGSGCAEGADDADCVPPPLPPRQPGMLEESSGGGGIGLNASSRKGSVNNLNVGIGGGSGGGNLPSRPPPNSIDTLLNYPLVSTCTAVRDNNMSAAFPLSQRPNIVQQLQQHQQLHGGCAGGGGGSGSTITSVCGSGNGAVATAALGQTPPNLNHFNKHRRVVSSPENMHPRHPDRHTKTTSGSWDLTEKDGEVTPPGTPPPPYPSSSLTHSHLHSHSTISAMSTSQHTLQGSSFSEEPPDCGDFLTDSGTIFVESYHFTPLAGAVSGGGGGPPCTGAIASGTISPIQAVATNVIQKEIMSMEDEDTSDQEGIDENGPFNYLQRLLEPENVAFLAVFLNYVLSNSEPAPLLFYLITGLYKEGTAKDMRKWAYEIHSTFLVPRAPLSWYRQDESLAREVDNVLQSEFDKVEILRKVFWKSRKRARDIICEQLRELQAKRTAGLGTIYGPTDSQLVEARGDKQKEQHIFEETLLRKLQFLLEEYEKDSPVEDPRKLALCSALSTVIHRIFITRSNPNSIIDRVHHFVSREKSFKSRLMGKNRKMIFRGHPLVLRQYYEVTHCNHCQTIIWGVSPQGYHCTDCKLNIHRSCSKLLDENCPGPLPQPKRKEPHNDNKISKLMGKIRPRTSSDFIAMEKRARHEEDFDPADFSNERLHSTSIVRQPSDRRPDTANASIRSNGNHSAAAASSQHNNSDLLHNSQASDASAGINSAADASVSSCGGSAVGGTSNAAGVGGADANAQDAADSSSRDSRKDRLQQQHQQNKSAPVSVNRSESYKERLSHKRSRNSRRKTSDPSLTSRPNDDQPDLGLSNSNYTASSNSSLSSGGGSESPSTSMEQVAAGAPGQHQQLQQQQQQPQQQQQQPQQQQLQQQYAAAGGHQHQHHHHHHHHHQHSHQDSFHGSSGSGSTPNNSSFWGGSIGGAGGPTIGQLARQWQFESDEEDDPLMEADWSSNVAADILAAFTDAEKKRQEIINEIYQTERNHVRTLKLLERLFFCPLQDSGVLSMDHLLLLFPPALVALRDLHGSFEQKLKQRRIEHNHVVNQVGDLLAGMFDGQSGDELCEYAAQFCARQQIALEALKEKRRKDETLQKILSKAESHKACRRLQLKDLLPTVLQRLTKYPLLFENLFKVTIRVVPDDVAEAEAIKRALESSKKILVDVNQAVKLAEDAHKLQNIQRKLDKSTFDKEEFKNLDLTQHRLIHDGSLTMKKNPGIQLHGLLFESMIVLLTKQDDKYSLKYLNATRISEVNNKPLSPIMNIDSETLVRQEAADKNSFFLIKTKTSQMLELRAPSSSECKTWFKHISDAAEQYKPRSKNASHEPVDDPAIATLPHSNTKESLEITPERPPPISATATMTTTPLAPMMMLPNNNSQHQQHHQQQQQQQHLHHQHSADLRNGREGTPTAEVGLPGSCSIFAHPGAVRNNRMNNNNSNEQALSVNRTMSTRSCGDSSSNNNNYSDRSNQLAQTATNGVILRHTQSARQAAAAAEDATSSQSGGSGSKRDSTSIIYSNNSNNTRTLMQSSPPLVEPTAIQISISPAHTAEPVLTPAEKLRRLDAAIRDGLLEKQKIICDMFRLPIEHFHEIVDIASLPEAPKDSADIALATYAQVQSLTEVVNEYMKVTPEQEISAVSTSVCDQCHEKQRKQQQHQHQQHSYSNTNGSNGNSNNNNSVFRTPLAPMSSHMPTSRSTSSALSAAAGASSAVQRARSPSPPPLPPPNKQQAQAQHKTATPSAKLQTHSIDAQIIHEDDDGYCEIDELRLPALPSMMPASMMVALLSKPAPAAAGAPPPLPPPAGTFKTPPPPPPPPATMKTTTQTTAAAAAVSGAAASAAEQTVLKSSSPELTKRQSTISAESIPEESADEVTQAMGDDGTGNDDDDDVRNKALLSSNPATSTATTAEAATSTETEKDEGEVDTALNKELKEGEISQPETTSSVGQTSSKQEQESPQKQEPGDGQKKDDVTEDREEDIPGQQSEEKEEQTQLEATAVAEITSNTLTSGTATVTAAATENMTDHVVDNAEKENKNVVASAEPQNQNSAANVEEDDTALSSKPNVEINDASVETLDALNKLKTALIMVDSMSQTTLTGNVSGGAGIAVNTPSYCGPSRILHATSLEPSVPCHALNSIVTALNAQISLLLPKINERDMERERLRKENQHLRELLNAMHERQRVEAKIETPKDITKCADDDANDEIDAPSNSNNNNTNAINTNNNNKTNININSKALSTPDDAATDSAAAVEAAKSTAAAEK